MKRRPSVDLACRWCVLLILVLTGCDNAPEHEPARCFAAALRSAAADLQQVGFHGQALGLLSEACRQNPTPAETEEIVDGYAAALREDEAARCLAAFHPANRSLEINHRILDLYLDGWHWSQAEALVEALGGNGDLEKGLPLSRTKRILEPFSRHLRLSWQAAVCQARSTDETLLLSYGSEPAAAGQAPGFFTPLGWNGGDFLLQTDLVLLHFEGDPRLQWGITTLPEARDGKPLVPSPVSRFLKIEYRPGEMTLSLQNEANDQPVTMKKRFYWPRGLWVTCSLEYLPAPALPARVKDEAPATGRPNLRFTMREKERGETLLRLECRADVRFAEGPMWAGFFFQPGSTACPSSLELSLDQFVFDN